MRILQLSTFDIRYGASIAARRLHDALLSSGLECALLVSQARSDSPRTYATQQGFEKFKAKARHRIDKLPLKLYPNRSPAQFSPNWVPSSLPRRVDALNPDVVHMHWCQTNFVPNPINAKVFKPIDKIDYESLVPTFLKIYQAGLAQGS